MTEYRIVELLQQIDNKISNKPKQDRWLNISEASDYTSVSTSTLRRNVKNGNLKASTKLGKLLFKVAELEKWLND
jgi:excisionase family DNA binding protein